MIRRLENHKKWRVAGGLCALGIWFEPSSPRYGPFLVNTAQHGTHRHTIAHHRKTTPGATRTHQETTEDVQAQQPTRKHNRQQHKTPASAAAHRELRVVPPGVVWFSFCSVWCCRVVCPVAVRRPGVPVLSGAVFCRVSPSSVCFAVVCRCVVLFAAVLCAVCVPGCPAVRSLSSPPCAVLLLGPALPWCPAPLCRAPWCRAAVWWCGVPS